MNYLDRYTKAMDEVRKEFKLLPETNIYECVVTLFEAYTNLKQQISQEKKDDKPKSSKSGRTK